MFLFVGALKVVGGGAIAGALVHRFFPIRANAGELRGRTFIGLSRRVRWENVESVRSRRWLFTSFLLLSSRGEKSALWLPLFLCKQREFERRVRSWLAPDHPVRRFIETETHVPTQSPTEVPTCPTS